MMHAMSTKIQPNESICFIGITPFGFTLTSMHKLHKHEVLSVLHWFAQWAGKTRLIYSLFKSLMGLNLFTSASGCQTKMAGAMCFAVAKVRLGTRFFPSLYQHKTSKLTLCSLKARMFISQLAYRRKKEGRNRTFTRHFAEGFNRV